MLVSLTNFILHYITTKNCSFFFRRKDILTSLENIYLKKSK